MRLRALFALATMAVVLTGCRDELTASGVRAVELEASADWPTSMQVGDLRRVRVTVRDAANGAVIERARVRWEISDREALEAIDSAGTAVLAALDVDTVDVTITLDQPGLAPARLTRRIAVEPSEWSGTFTVGRYEPVALRLTGDSTLAAAIDTIHWGASSSILDFYESEDTANRLHRLGGTLDVLPLRSGQAFLFAQVVFTDGSELFGAFPVFVGAPVVTTRPGAAWPTTLQYGDSVRLQVFIHSAESVSDSLDPDDMVLQFRSTNPSVLQVDGTTGWVRAIGRGSGEIVASVGGAEIQTTELRGTVQVLQTWRSITAGYRHTCALSSTRQGYCWGNNTFGELGIGALGGLAATPAPLGTAVRFEQLTAGGVDLPQLSDEEPTSDVQAHSCGRAASYVFCWGAANNGQVGEGRAPCYNLVQVSGCRQSLPREVYDGSGQWGNVTNVSAGGQISCAATQSDAYDFYEPFPAFSRVSCWGWGVIYQDFGTEWRFGRRPLWHRLYQNISIPDFTVAAGGAHACFPLLRSVGSVRAVYCVGDNRWGQLGDGDTLPRTVPDSGNIEVGDAALTRAVRRAGGAAIAARALTAGARHTCAIDASTGATTTAPGAVWCWGGNEFGQLGAPTTARCGPDARPCSRVAVLVSTTQRFTRVGAGGGHTCALTEQGEVWCWGDNRDGQLGLGTVGGAVATPARVITTVRFVDLAVGGAHTCAVTAIGAAYCWGRNAEGQLGRGSASAPLTRPTRVTEPPL